LNCFNGELGLQRKLRVDGAAGFETEMIAQVHLVEIGFVAAMMIWKC
jgi:hypothetical protein